jgi:hypothetical protein
MQVVFSQSRETCKTYTTSIKRKGIQNKQTSVYLFVLERFTDGMASSSSALASILKLQVAMRA